MRAILAAICRAPSAAFSTFRAAVRLPLRILDTILGGDSWGIPPVQLPYVAEPEDLSPPKIDLSREYDDLSTDLMSRCAISIIDDAPAEILPKWPWAIGEWARGLDECDTIMNSEKREVCAHICRLLRLKGVRAVQPLEPGQWEPDGPVADFDYGSPGFAVIADACSRGL
jgi:hypothetical protein